MWWQHYASDKPREDSSCYDCSRQTDRHCTGLSTPTHRDHSFVMRPCGRYLGLHCSPSSSGTHVPDFIARLCLLNEPGRMKDRPGTTNRAKPPGCDNQLHELFTYYIELTTPIPKLPKHIVTIREHLPYTANLQYIVPFLYCLPSKSYSLSNIAEITWFKNTDIQFKMLVLNSASKLWVEWLSTQLTWCGL